MECFLFWQDKNDFNYIKNRLSIDVLKKNNFYLEDDLHLAITIRSFRSEKLSYFVDCLLELDIKLAKEIYNQVRDEYPIVLTRDLDKAKDWLRHKARGTERYGLLASSGAKRLKPVGIDVNVSVDAPKWFLNGKNDVRSSYFLEQVATEFDIQGLELDWTCVVWDIDFFYSSGKWIYRKFKGTKWQNVNDAEKKKYLINAYRVLLTRARQGMVIVVPEGSNQDITRTPEYYDQIFDLMKGIGINSI